ncbi:MAG: zinc-ribbon domain-containing protein [Pirellulales bacterium]|nr:zinc-ribbon domain-containing protein [Pirellulales bacterium]
MCFVICPTCQAQIDIPDDAVGPNRTDLWNVVHCDDCGTGFDYDDEVQGTTELDPTECYLAMFAAMSRKEYATARERALTLKAWLTLGGFYPPRYTETEVNSYLAGMLRRTSHLAR